MIKNYSKFLVLMVATLLSGTHVHGMNMDIDENSQYSIDSIDSIKTEIETNDDKENVVFNPNVAANLNTRVASMPRVFGFASIAVLHEHESPRAITDRSLSNGYKTDFLAMFKSREENDEDDQNSILVTESDEADYAQYVEIDLPKTLGKRSRFCFENDYERDLSRRGVKHTRSDYESGF